MDLFEEMEKKQTEEQNYKELAVKQKRQMKQILTTVFSIIGALFLVIGLCDFAFDFGEEYVIGIVYCIIGPLFILAGLLCWVLINPQKIMTYEKYKKSLEKNSYNYPTLLQFQLLEKRVEALEEKIEKLSK